ncbi:MAG: hypothetical protein GY832_07250, partial [Chloroflexi bacterium]|nr:hypothetical protein [Chloroflexota bacterium]
IFGEPSSTQFYLDGGGVNSGTDNWLGLLWEAIPGFSAFGPYTGNGSADGPFIYTGFKSRWLLIKRTDSTGSWFLYDTVRNTFNPVDLGLFADASVAEAVQSNGQVDILSNGFKIKGSGTAINASGGTYIYAAFAEAVNIPGISQVRAR